MSRPRTPDGATATRGNSAESWDLRLYVTGQSPNSLRAVENLRRAWEEHVPGRYRIEVVDLLENPRLAADVQILAIPAVVRRLPSPSRARPSGTSPTPTVCWWACRSGSRGGS